MKFDIRHSNLTIIKVKYIFFLIKKVLKPFHADKRVKKSNLECIIQSLNNPVLQFLIFPLNRLRNISRKTFEANLKFLLFQWLRSWLVWSFRLCVKMGPILRQKNQRPHLPTYLSVHRHRNKSNQTPPSFLWHFFLSNLFKCPSLSLSFNKIQLKDVNETSKSFYI